jgi:GT2 family glycosyltransferase
MLEAQIDCSAIIVNYNGGQDLIDCIASLQRQRSVSTEVIVVDNGSSDGSLAKATAAYPWLRVIESPTNDGFAGGANKGAWTARGESLLFLNPDVVLHDTCVAELCAQLRTHPGVVGPRLYIEASGVWEYGVVLDIVGFPVGLRAPGQPLYVAGCALATGRHTFNRVGGFDARYFMIYEDADYCWRVLLAGEQVSVVTQSTTVHRGGGSTPGGYVRSGRQEVSSFRIPLLERNRLATLLKCAPIAWLVFAGPAAVTSTIAIALWALTLRRWQLSRDLISALSWNARELPATLRARRRGPLALRRGAAIRGRILRSAYVPAALARRGLPRFVR